MLEAYLALGLVCAALKALDRALGGGREVIDDEPSGGRDGAAEVDGVDHQRTGGRGRYRQPTHNRDLPDRTDHLSVVAVGQKEDG